MRKAINSWILIAGCLVILGGTAFIGAQTPRGTQLPAATIKRWRQYATEVERGTRVPSAIATRMLTETAIGQYEYAISAGRLLRFVSAGVVALGLLLIFDLVRHRGRHAQMTPLSTTEQVGKISQR